MEVLAGFGLTQAKIAQVLGIDVTTLTRHYRAEIDRGSASVEAKLAGNLLKIASGTDGTALRAIMFSLRARFGWTIPADPADEALVAAIGKKEAAQRAAQTAGEASEWGDDLRPPARPN